MFLMQRTAAVFCHNGLGDGINTLVLSDLLHLNGFAVTTYHNSLNSMQNWFPQLPVRPYPKREELPPYDHYFVVWNDASDFVKELIREGKQKFSDRMHVIYLYPSASVRDEPYYSDCLIDPGISVADNLRNLVKNVLRLPHVVTRSPLTVPAGLTFRAHPKRVVIHPTSGRVSKNWPAAKFVKLALHLKRRGFEPVVVPGAHDLDGWGELAVQDFATLDALARFIYESVALVGNDSGLGHLASALRIPTLVICRRQAVAKLWAPSFLRGKVLTPPSWIPNIRGLRLRDRHWHKFVRVGAARRAFYEMTWMSGC